MTLINVNPGIAGPEPTAADNQRIREVVDRALAIVRAGLEKPAGIKRYTVGLFEITVVIADAQYAILVNRGDHYFYSISSTDDAGNAVQLFSPAASADINLLIEVLTL